MVGQRGWQLDFNFIMEIWRSEETTFDTKKKKKSEKNVNVSVYNPSLIQKQTRPTVVLNSHRTDPAAPSVDV